jgi:hypothetical protein
VPFVSFSKGQPPGNADGKVPDAAPEDCQITIPGGSDSKAKEQGALAGAANKRKAGKAGVKAPIADQETHNHACVARSKGRPQNAAGNAAIGTGRNEAAAGSCREAAEAQEQPAEPRSGKRVRWNLHEGDGPPVVALGHAQMGGCREAISPAQPTARGSCEEAAAEAGDNNDDGCFHIVADTQQPEEDWYGCDLMPKEVPNTFPDSEEASGAVEEVTRRVGPRAGRLSMPKPPRRNRLHREIAGAPENRGGAGRAGGPSLAPDGAAQQRGHGNAEESLLAKLQLSEKGNLHRAGNCTKLPAARQQQEAAAKPLHDCNTGAASASRAYTGQRTPIQWIRSNNREGAAQAQPTRRRAERMAAVTSHQAPMENRIAKATAAEKRRQERNVQYREFYRQFTTDAGPVIPELGEDGRSAEPRPAGRGIPESHDMCGERARSDTEAAASSGHGSGAGASGGSGAPPAGQDQVLAGSATAPGPWRPGCALRPSSDDGTARAYEGRLCLADARTGNPSVHSREQQQLQPAEGQCSTLQLLSKELDEIAPDRSVRVLRQAVAAQMVLDSASDAAVPSVADSPAGRGSDSRCVEDGEDLAVPNTPADGPALRSRWPRRCTPPAAKRQLDEVDGAEREDCARGPASTSSLDAAASAHWQRIRGDQGSVESQDDEKTERRLSPSSIRALGQAAAREVSQQSVRQCPPAVSFARVNKYVIPSELEA